jgi:hypothetical protein
MGDGRIFLKTAATLPLIKIYRMSLISTRSISLDSTFNPGVSFLLIMHFCFEIRGPPNMGMSRQKVHIPQLAKQRKDIIIYTPEPYRKGMLKV